MKFESGAYFCAGGVVVPHIYAQQVPADYAFLVRVFFFPTREKPGLLADSLKPRSTHA